MAIDSKELETILNRHKRWLDEFSSSYARMIAAAPIPAFYGGIQDADEALPHFRADFSGTDVQGADLSGADFTLAKFGGADLSGANFRKANLLYADFQNARLTRADLRDARLEEADLTGANLTEAQLAGANLVQAVLAETVFGRTILTEARGLSECRHSGPSIIDFHTLQTSGPLPLAFLRGVGLPDSVIDDLPALRHAGEFYSCFISYSSKDEIFAKRLHNDLQDKGVRCWFAPRDMSIGDKIVDAVDKAIRQQDKVLLILSEGAIASNWVADEVTRALEEERTRKQLIILPVRIDDAVMRSSLAWASLLRDQRNIGDFTRKDRDSYDSSLDRLLRDLRMKHPRGAPRHAVVTGET